MNVPLLENTALLGSEVRFVPPWPRGSHSRPHERSSDACTTSGSSFVFARVGTREFLSAVRQCSFLSYASRLVPHPGQPTGFQLSDASCTKILEIRCVLCPLAGGVSTHVFFLWKINDLRGYAIRQIIALFTAAHCDLLRIRSVLRPSASAGKRFRG